jgi:uncharacterized membrane protein SpoIIM required for sporulation
VTPLQFEALYHDEWAEAETLLNELRGSHRRPPVSGSRLAALYRRACEQLALARARDYPVYIVDRLERITSAGHEAIYRRRDLNAARVGRFLATEFPQAVRRHRWYVALSTAVFVVPALAAGVAIYLRPELILSVTDSVTAASFEEMYSPSADSLGRTRTASTDWTMFGYYINNNISIALQCMAGGLFAGLGSLFYLAYNGAFTGALAGFLTERGLSQTFYSFIATHSSFELTAIVLSGAAGLRVGHALIVPDRLTRRQALVTASRDVLPIVYGLIVMLLIAAAVEAFWSSASWIAPPVKYAVAFACWTGVVSYFLFQGRRAG